MRCGENQNSRRRGGGRGVGAYTNDRRNNNLRACFFFLVFFFFFFLFLLSFFPSFSLNLHWTAFFTMHMQTGHSSSRRIASLLAFVSNRSGAQPAAKKKRRSHKKRDVRLVHHPPLFFPPSLGFRFHTYLQHSLATTPISCTPPRHPRHRSFLSFIHRFSERR